MKTLVTWMAYALFMALIGALLGEFYRSIDKTNQKDKEDLVDKEYLVWIGLIISVIFVLVPLLLECAFIFMVIPFDDRIVLKVVIVLGALLFFIVGSLLCIAGALLGNRFTKTIPGTFTGAVFVAFPLTALSLYLFWFTFLFAAYE
ncbi:MAG: hypothetical protein J0L96_15820 [Anaerolineae bacterium]|nr:hypothetical protein [Anaerolineae bacterium]